MVSPALLALALGTLGAIAGQLDPSAELWAEPAVPVAEFGGAVRVTLRARCNGSEPPDSPGMETTFTKRVVAQSPGESVLELLRVTEWSSSNFIYHTCERRATRRIPFVVYSLPAPELTPSRPDAWHLSCSVSYSVSGPASVGNVTVSLRHGGDAVLSSRSGRGSGQSPPDTVGLSHSLPARPEDHGKSVTCEALLDVSPPGAPVKVTSKPLVLNLTALPEGPLLDAPQDQELGVPFNVTCSVRRDVPAADFSVTAANRSFPVTPGPEGHRASAEVTLSRAGSARVSCAVRVRDSERRTESSVHVFHVPTPRLAVTSTTPLAGTTLSGNCSLPPAGSSNVRLRVRAGATDLTGWGQSPVSFRLAVGDKDMELRCEAELHGLSAAPKNHSLWITVHALPRLDEARCPRRQNWTEGLQGSLRCGAEGRPEPQVSCARDGNALAPGTPLRARRSHAGTYLCRATNAAGTAERNVTVSVLYTDPVPLLPVLLGVLLPALALLALAGAVALYRRSTKIGEYWLWRKQQRQPAELRPLRAAGSAPAAAVPNGAP